MERGAFKIVDRASGPIRLAHVRSIVARPGLGDRRVELPGMTQLLHELPPPMTTGTGAWTPGDAWGADPVGAGD